MIFFSVPDNFVVTWKQNGVLIFQNKIATGIANGDPRYEVFQNNTIKITNLTENDSGEFACEILESKDKEPVRVIHKLAISTPAKVLSLSPSTHTKVSILVGFIRFFQYLITIVL